VKKPTSARTTPPKPATESGVGDVSAIAPSTAYTATTAAPSPPAATMPRDRPTIQDPAGSMRAKLMLKDPREIYGCSGAAPMPQMGEVGPAAQIASSAMRAPPISHRRPRQRAYPMPARIQMKAEIPIQIPASPQPNSAVARVIGT
jgi:hypothetical protein